MSTLFHRWLSLMPVVALMLSLSLSMVGGVPAQPPTSDELPAGIVTVDPNGYWERRR